MAGGVRSDMERSRTFARTLRQSGQPRWWTAKYDNAPRYQPGSSNVAMRRYQSAPDLAEEPRPSRPGRANSLQAARICPPRHLRRTESVAAGGEWSTPVRAQVVSVNTLTLQQRDPVTKPQIR